MENKSGIIKNITTKTKADGGKSYTVDIDHGGEVVKYLCYDGKIAEKKIGDKLEFGATVKDYGIVMVFPKAKGTGGGGGKRDDRFYTTVNALLQSHTMPMSYAKDAVRDMYVSIGLKEANEKEIFVLEENESSQEEINKLKSEYLNDVLTFYNAFRAEIQRDSVLTDLLGISAPEKAEDKPTVTTERKTAPKKAKGKEEKPIPEPELPPAENVPLSGVHLDLQNSIKEHILAVGKKYVLPEDMAEKVLYRLSQRKPDGSLGEGTVELSNLNEAEAKKVFDLFHMFRFKNCPGKMKGCDYHRKTDEYPNYCSWVLSCMYQQQKEGGQNEAT